MILADTSVWIDHFRAADPQLVDALEAGRVAIHPCIIGEIALGALKNRRHVLARLDRLYGAPVASDLEVCGLIEARGLHGAGIGYVDAHLLASTLLQSGLALWTRDRRLGAAAERLGIAYEAH